MENYLFLGNDDMVVLENLITLKRLHEFNLDVSSLVSGART